VNEENWEFGFRGVLAVPVGKVLGGRLLSGEKCLRPERE
jgi:hypothetical protein